MRKLIISIALCLLSFFIYGQSSPKLSAPKTYLEGNEIIIEYDIVLGYKVASCTVSLFVSTDGGKLFYPFSLKKVSGDVGLVESSGHKRIAWRVTEEQQLLNGEDIQFDIRTSDIQYKSKSVIKSEEKKIYESGGDLRRIDRPSMVLIQYAMGVYPQLSYGAMVGWSKGAGAYIKYRDSFVDDQYDNESLSESFVTSYDINKKPFRVITAGVLVRVAKWLYLYTGAGYGERSLIWQNPSQKWTRITDYSLSGVSVDGGAIFRFGLVSISAGYNTINFKYSNIEVGVGFTF